MLWAHFGKLNFHLSRSVKSVIINSFLAKTDRLFLKPITFNNRNVKAILSLASRDTYNVELVMQCLV